VIVSQAHSAQRSLGREVVEVLFECLFAARTDEDVAEFAQSDLIANPVVLPQVTACRDSDFRALRN